MLHIEMREQKNEPGKSKARKGGFVCCIRLIVGDNADLLDVKFVSA